MNFNLDKSIQILERTPATLLAMLAGIDEDWTSQNEGSETWSAFDIIGHLVHGEKTDWITRTKIILEQGENRTFDSFDRFAQIETSKGKSLAFLLEEFMVLRAENLKTLASMEISEDQLNLKGIHLELGEVTLRELLSTWTAHDLGHIAQIARVMAKQYKDQVGPWQQYIPILHK